MVQQTLSLSPLPLRLGLLLALTTITTPSEISSTTSQCRHHLYRQSFSCRVWRWFSRFVCSRRGLVLSDDKIVWGSAAVASVGAVQNGQTPFGSNQVSPVLRDERAYLLECSSVVTNTVPPRVLQNVFKLPFQPVDGSGSGKPTNRTDLVTVRTGDSLRCTSSTPLLLSLRLTLRLHR